MYYLHIFNNSCFFFSNSSIKDFLIGVGPEENHHVIISFVAAAEHQVPKFQLGSNPIVERKGALFADSLPNAGEMPGFPMGTAVQIGIGIDAGVAEHRL